MTEQMFIYIKSWQIKCHHYDKYGFCDKSAKCDKCIKDDKCYECIDCDMCVICCKCIKCNCINCTKCKCKCICNYSKCINCDRCYLCNTVNRYVYLFIERDNHLSSANSTVYKLNPNDAELYTIIKCIEHIDKNHGYKSTDRTNLHINCDSQYIIDNYKDILNDNKLWLKFKELTKDKNIIITKLSDNDNIKYNTYLKRYVY